MRLIDADKLLALVKKNAPYIYHVLWPIVSMTPVVIVEPNKHGEWVNVRTSAFCPYEMEIEEKCSLCGRYVYRYGTQQPDNYCPGCGADMRGVNDAR